ncbi:MAG: hypothetical protein ABQ298_15515 [Puniceicoccaceae bacterium]
MDQKPKVELEDLLKLKTFEKPEPEFWEKFDQGLRRKSMEALVKEDPSVWRLLWERRGLQQLAFASAFALCAVPAFLGVQSYYAEQQTHEPSFQVVAQSATDEAQARKDLNERVAETTRELAMRKQKADSMRFVVDSYAVDPSAYRFESDVWAVGDEAWKQSNRTYVSDRVKLLPGETGVMPVNLSY